MVTIDETVDNNVTVHEQPETMNCPKCEQRFFLKSNLEVHTLFCKGIVFEQNAGCRDVEITVNTEEINSSLNSVSKLAVFTEDQTFEYVPIDSNSTNCTTCTQRLPEGAILGDSITDLALLVSHSKKKGCDGEMEIYVCDECEREFLYKYPVKKNNKHQQHRNKTTTLCKKRKIKSEKPYSCSICNRGFLNEQSKNEHEENHASTQSRYSCATCGEKFITRNMLQNHYDSRNECHPTKCDVCSRVFVHSSHLKRHLSIHAGIKPFSCEFCGHEFNQKSDLLRHEKKHTINGTYVCMKCSKAFTDIKILKEHIETHKNEENTKQIFACDRCDKVFGRKSHFKRHMTIHDGIKPYACEKCGKRFNQRTDLKRHMLSHFRREMKVVSCSNSVKKGDDNLICVVCNKVFTDHASFLQHDMQHQKVMSTGVLY